ncbi:MAG: MBL fold metallo-hydrolase [Clostridia bacterium]|nr:MBL fold metallo-hydrolase [Clostridia bacterium]
MKETTFTVTYYMHSGFSVASGDILLVFDYWRGEYQELPPERQITEEYIRAFSKVYVFISHEHPDHMDDIVLTWKDWGDVTYIISDGLPLEYKGSRMTPGSQLTLSDRLLVRAYDSTDLGVSWYIELDGHSLFHAGDLNFWHWRNESTLKQIEREEAEFVKKTAPIAEEKIDLAFFPMDPRQGDMSDAGANYFIMTVKPRILVPMHFWTYIDAVKDFAHKSRVPGTEIIPMIQSGEELDVIFSENGGMEIVTYAPAPIMQLEYDEPLGNKNVMLEEYAGENPFAESDMPINFDEPYEPGK